MPLDQLGEQSSRLHLLLTGPCVGVESRRRRKEQQIPDRGNTRTPKNKHKKIKRVESKKITKP